MGENAQQEKKMKVRRKKVWVMAYDGRPSLDYVGESKASAIQKWNRASYHTAYHTARNHAIWPHCKPWGWDCLKMYLTPPN